MSQSVTVVKKGALPKYWMKLLHCIQMFNCLNTTCCVYFLQLDFVIFNPLSANTTKWSNTLKQFVGNRRLIIWVCYTILKGWYIKGLMASSQKMKFSIKDFFSKCDQIHGKLRIWLHLLNKSLMENFIFCALLVPKELSILWEEMFILRILWG